ncbi:hypothetical protein HGM15179_006503 [Zosterops borbonicus]|uniref:Uncharacterized protein n=1 Tax=Zosterops borbonicus TaxID=364589 RepID=A0A8K1GMQ5_9PASS|nr:hypothetical protein HGM15179_006503 [Zosterops borbonicus]
MNQVGKKAKGIRDCMEKNSVARRTRAMIVYLCWPLPRLLGLSGAILTMAVERGQTVRSSGCGDTDDFTLQGPSISFGIQSGSKE